MENLFFVFATLLSSITVFSQVRYSGFIDKYPIEFVADVSASYGDGVYAYKKYNTPISLSAKMQNGIIIFSEKDGN